MIPFHYRPIWSRVLLDIATISITMYSLMISDEKKIWPTSLALVSLSFFITLATAGWRTRWTLSFPLIVVFFLQCLRAYFIRYSVIWCGRSLDHHSTISQEVFCTNVIKLSLIQTISWSFIVISTILSLLFPPVQLRRVSGPHHVAVIDLHIPISKNNDSGGSKMRSQSGGDFVMARIAYPTQSNTNLTHTSAPFLPLKQGKEFCNLFMQKGGAPAAIKALTFLLHHWRLIRIHRVTSFSDTSESSSSSPPPSPPPPLTKNLHCIVFSHGLTGNAITYSDLILNLASHGYCVVALDHTDGSALHIFGPNGLEIPLDESIQKLDRPESSEEYVKARREKTCYRVEEMISFIEEFSSIDSPSILGLIKVDKVIGIGHSFGGATALTAAALRPDLFECVVALDPAMDWMPDYSRWAWLGQRCTDYMGGTGGYSSLIKEEREISVYDTPCCFIYSEEWESLGWGGYPFVKSLHQKGMMGPRFNSVTVVPGSSHMSFSDICMLIPTWIGRSLGLTGKRNPHDVSEEIGLRVLDFLSSVLNSK